MAIYFSDGTSQTSAAGGKILQVKTFQKTDSATYTPDSQLVFKDTGMTLDITPSATTSKILVNFVLFGDCQGDGINNYFRVSRAISGGSTSYITAADQGNRVGTLFIGSMGLSDSAGSTPTQITMSDYLDSPSTTSAVTYTIQHTSHGSDIFYLNRSADTNDQDSYEDGISWITLKEVGA